MKKSIFIILIISIILILTSAISVFASDTKTYYFGSPAALENCIFPYTGQDVYFQIWDKTGYKVAGASSSSHLSITDVSLNQFTFMSDDTAFHSTWLHEGNPVTLQLNQFPLIMVVDSSIPLVYPNFPGYYDDFTGTWYDSTGTDINGRQLTTVSLKKGESVSFTYTSANKSLFLESITSVSDGLSATMHYTTPKIKESVEYTRANRWNVQNTMFNLIDKSDFPSPRTLTTGEILDIYHVNSYDDSARLNITFDTLKCKYQVSNYKTGYIIDTGNVTPQDGQPAPNSDLNIYDTSDITGADRQDYADGWLGDLQYGFDSLIGILKIPLDLLIKFFTAIGDYLSQAISVANPMLSALNGVYGILPQSVSWLLGFAIIFSVLKLVFGR